MFSLVRSGPKILVAKSRQAEELKSYLTSKMNAFGYDLNTAFEKAGEDYTIIFLTEEVKEVNRTEDIKETLVLMEEPDVVLCSLINDGKNQLVESIRTAPRMIFLRAIGDLGQVMEQIQKDQGGITGKFREVWNLGRAETTIVAVTDKPLHRSLRLSELYEECLLVDRDYYPLLWDMRLHALKYLNAGLKNKDWYEIEIRIYDRYSAYMLHHKRLLEVLEHLELGIILGESWAKDYPRPFMSVEVYRVRFFTFYEPQYIKKMLVGLEHLEDGVRIVDYDVYYNHKKLGWTDVIDSDDPKARHLVGEKYRKEIFSRLSEENANFIKALEQEILMTRTS